MKNYQITLTSLKLCIKELHEAFQRMCHKFQSTIYQ